jgi:hypothetical protein
MSMFDMKMLRKGQIAAHGMREMKAHRVPSLNAPLMMSATSGGSCWRSETELRPSPIEEPKSTLGICPLAIASLIIALTFPLRTAPHWARPTVPPKERNYGYNILDQPNGRRSDTHKEGQRGDNCNSFCIHTESCLDGNGTELHADADTSEGKETGAGSVKNASFSKKGELTHQASPGLSFPCS